MILAFGYVRVPVIAADGQVGDQMMKVRLVHYHYAGVRQSRRVSVLVEWIVPDLINGRVELPWIKRPHSVLEYFHLYKFRQFVK